MSKVAVIADIHGNPFALDAVLAALDEQHIDEVIVAGDLVGRGPLGDEVVQRIMATDFRCIRGNHEDYLRSFHRKDVPESWLTADQWAASRWMANQLSQQAYEFIDELPLSARSEAIPDIQVFHGSPIAYDDGIGPWTPQSRLQSHLNEIPGKVLACAHTHRPMVEKFGDQLVVNVGAVGLPFNGDTRAQFAVFTETDDGIDVEIARVDYPKERLLQAYHTSGFLIEGDITAQLLFYEVKKARPYLVPFLTWANLCDRAPGRDAVPDFLRRYRDDIPPHEFMQQLHADRS